MCLELEGAFLRVPCECLSQVFRATQKTVTRELGGACGSVKQLGEAAQQGNLQTSKALEEVNATLQRLEQLRRVVVAADTEEQQYISRIVARLEHLKHVPPSLANDHSAGPVTPPDADEHAAKWEKLRLDRWIADYLLQCGFFESAAALTEEAHLHSFVDLDLHKTIRAAEEGLLRGDCQPALQWCAENASRLRRVNKSDGQSLEFSMQLRLRQFLELVRVGDRIAALENADQHLTPTVAEHADVQLAMATLLYAGRTEKAPGIYQSLFAPDCWKQLAMQLREVAGKAFCLPQPPTLVQALQLGLSALKTAACYEGPSSTEQARLASETGTGGQPSDISPCPVCSEEGRTLAASLPFSHHQHSTLLCRITGDIMDERNPPMALPNGQVYSSTALRKMAESSHDGSTIICPTTGETYMLRHARSVFII